MCAQIASGYFQSGHLLYDGFNSHVRTDCISRALRASTIPYFNSPVRTDCIGRTSRLRLQQPYFNSPVRTDCISKNKQKFLLTTINLAQPHYLNSSAHSILLAIKGGLLLLHRCEPPCKIMWTDASRAQYTNTCSCLYYISVLPKSQTHVRLKKERALWLFLFLLTRNEDRHCTADQGQSKRIKAGRSNSSSVSESHRNGSCTICNYDLISLHFR